MSQTSITLATIITGAMLALSPTPTSAQPSSAPPRPGQSNPAPKPQSLPAKPSATTPTTPGQPKPRPDLPAPPALKDATNATANLRELASLATFGFNFEGNYHAGASARDYHPDFYLQMDNARRYELLASSEDAAFTAIANSARLLTESAHQLNVLTVDFGDTPEKSINSFRNGVMGPAIWYAWSAQDDYDRWRQDGQVVLPDGRQIQVDNGPFKESARTFQLGQQFKASFDHFIANYGKSGELGGMILMANILNDSDLADLWKRSLLPGLQAAASATEATLLAPASAGESASGYICLRPKKTLHNAAVEIQISTELGDAMSWYGFFHTLPSGSTTTIIPPNQSRWLGAVGGPITWSISIYSDEGTQKNIAPPPPGKQADRGSQLPADPARHNEFASTLRKQHKAAADLRQFARSLYGPARNPTAELKRLTEALSVGSQWGANLKFKSGPQLLLLTVKSQDPKTGFYTIEADIPIDPGTIRSTSTYTGQLVPDTDRGIALGLREPFAVQKYQRPAKGSAPTATPQEVDEANKRLRERETRLKSGKTRLLTSPREITRLRQQEGDLFDGPLGVLGLPGPAAMQAKWDETEVADYAIGFDRAGRPTLQLRSLRCVPLVRLGAPLASP